jgi:hypothetical protein
MAKSKVERGRPVEVRSGSQVGPSYPEGKRVIPWGDDMDGEYGGEHDKAISSPNKVLFDGAGMPLRHGYDELWEGK